MNYEKRRYKKTGGLRNLNVGKSAENQLDCTNHKLREVLTMIGDERALINTIRKRQRKWIGHWLKELLHVRTAIQ